MNSLHARRWLEAEASCSPELGFDGPLKLIEEHPNASWEGALRGDDAAIFRLVSPPKVDARWDARAKAWLSSPARRTLKARPFKASAFGEPSASALAAFHAVAPVGRVLSSGSEDWTLELERPLPWPLFLRCDVSAAFLPRASRTALLLRDAKVVSLEFDGAALWARFIG